MSFTNAAKLDIKDGSQSLPYTPWLDFYSPTYQTPVPVADLLPLADGNNRSVKNPAKIPDTVRMMKKIIVEQTKTCKGLAKWLKADTLEQSAYNVWRFLKDNVQYRLDDPGTEQLRTPARCWHDRVYGIDCDDYTIFAACILRAMGYNPRIRLVAFRNRTNFSHVYLMVENYPLDVVMNLFNIEPKGVTKTEDVLIDGLGCAGNGQCNCENKSLSGMETASPLMMGLGTIAPPNPLTLALIDRQNNILEMQGLGSLDEQTAAREFRKTHWGVLMNGLEEQVGYVDALPYIYDVEGGNAVFGANVDSDAVAMIGAVKAVNRLAQKWAKQDPNDPEILSFADYTRAQVDGLDGLGELAASNEYMATVIGELDGRVPRKKRKGWQKFKKGLKKIGRGVFLRFNPLTVMARGAFLSLVILNFPKQLGAKLAIGYFSPEEAAKYGLKYEELESARKATKKAENIFYKLGGKREKFKKAVMKGWRRSKTKKLLEKARGLKGLGYDRELVYTGRDLFPDGQVMGFGGATELVYSNLNQYPSGQVMGFGGTSSELVYSNLNQYPSGQVMGLGELEGNEMDGMEAFAAVLGELIYTDYVPQMEAERQAGNLGVLPIPIIIAKAAAVLTPVAAIVKKAAPAFKAVNKIIGKAAESQEQQPVEQQQPQQEQQPVEQQQPQQEQQPVEQQQPQQEQPQTEGEQTQNGLGFFKKLFNRNPAKKAARVAERKQSGTRLARFIKKTTGVDLRKKDRRNDPTPMIQTDGGIPPSAGQRAANMFNPASLIAKTSYNAGNAMAPTVTLPDVQINATDTKNKTASKFPLKTALWVGGGIVIVGGVIYFLTRKKSNI